MSDHANNAAVVAAGYALEQTDRGATASPRYMTRYSKPMTGEPGASGGLWRHTAYSDVSQADADAKALVSVNGARRMRYGVSSSAGNGGLGGALTFDVT